ncbi:MAG: hypothetical protein ACFE75_08845 [Candidatus Hodarchaeota archaeon]
MNKEEKETGIDDPFREISKYIKKLHNIDLSRLRMLIKDIITEKIEKEEENAEKIRLSKYFEKDYSRLTKFLEELFEHLRVYDLFTTEALNRINKDLNYDLLNIVKEVFKEMTSDSKLKSFFKKFTIKYMQGNLEFGLMYDAYIVVLDINDVIKDLFTTKIDSKRLAYNSKKSAESIKKFNDRLENCISKRTLFYFV